MQDLRKRLFTIVSIVVAIIIVLTIFFIVRNRNRNRPAPNTPEVTVTQPVIPATDPAVPTKPLPIFADEPVPSASDTPDEQYVQQVARIFVERVNSYSNQNKNSHIDDVELLATDRMITYLRTQGVEQNENYAGVTTRVIASSVTSLSSSAAEVRLGVQQYYEGENAPDTAYKTGKVNLVQIDGDWKVGGLFWEERE